MEPRIADGRGHLAEENLASAAHVFSRREILETNHVVVGRRAIFYLGAYRPLVGAIFGLAMYFLLQSSLLQVQSGKEFSTFVVAAFLGGFSERFVKVMLNSAEKTVGGAGGPSAASGPAPAPVAADPAAVDGATS